MAPDSPSPAGLELLRSATDEAVFRLLMTTGRLTRADIAARSGISKPTVSKSVRRLEALSLVSDTGERTTGVGRAGNYYAVDPAAGVGLVGAITPDLISLQLVDSFGKTLQTASEALPLDPGEGVVRAALTSVAKELVSQAVGPVRVAVFSAADPVDRESGRLVQLPDAPFLVGQLDAHRALRGVIDGVILVDNDVNWAARAERLLGAAQGIDDFVMIHLGKGLGMSVVADGKVRLGHVGLAGEPSHVITTGPGGRAMAFTEVFAELGLRRPPGTEVDLEAVDAALATDDGLAAISTALVGVVGAAIAFADPEIVLLGGPWGPNERLVEALNERLTSTPRTVAVAPAVVESADLEGARLTAIDMLRDALVALTR